MCRNNSEGKWKRIKSELVKGQVQNFTNENNISHDPQLKRKIIAMRPID